MRWLLRRENTGNQGGKNIDVGFGCFSAGSKLRSHRPLAEVHLSRAYPFILPFSISCTSIFPPTLTGALVLGLLIMAERKSAYGAPASDTDFRKKWDREEYEEKAKKEQEERREEAKARYEAKLEGKKWHKPVDFSSLDATSARSSRLDVASMVGKSTLVPAGAGVGRRGKGAGFYCEACDLTYKDNVQYIEHLNSKQHLVNTGQSGEVKRATLRDVRDRLEMLKARKRHQEEEDRRLGEVDIQERIKKAEEVDATEREEKRRKRNEKRRAAKAANGVKQEDEWEGRLGIIS